MAQKVPSAIATPYGMWRRGALTAPSCISRTRTAHRRTMPPSVSQTAPCHSSDTTACSAPAREMKAAAGEGYATATDLADWLVRTLKMPFRDAHHVTGRIVGLASKQGVALHELPLQAMQEVEPDITAEALRVLSVEASVKSRTSYGGTAPKNVLSQAKAWLKRLEKERKLG